MLNKLSQKINSGVNRLKRKRRSPVSKKSSKSKLGRLSFRFNSGKVIALSLLIIMVLGMLKVGIPLLNAAFFLEFKRDSSYFQEERESWYGDSRLIVLAAGVDEVDSTHKFIDAINLFVFEPDTQRLGIFAINPDLNIYIPEVKSSVNLRTLFNNKLTEENEVFLLRSGIESLLAVKIDRYVVMSMDGFQELSNSFNNAHLDLTLEVRDTDIESNWEGVDGWGRGYQTIDNKEYLPFLASDVNGRNDQLNRNVRLFGEIMKDMDSVSVVLRLPEIAKAIADYSVTDFSKTELVYLFKSIWGMRSDQVRYGFTREESSLASSVLGIYKRRDPIPESIDEDLGSILYDFNIAKEQGRIELLNGSGYGGYASSRARWLTNAGGRIVHFGNSYEVFENTTIFVENPEQFPATIKEIERIFKGKVEYADEAYKHKHIGDIIVVIGKDVK